MTETQKRIKKYREALPGQKAKVLASLMLLVMAAVIATSTTFAWIVLSTNPEVTGINTTVTANGNLEIALSDKPGLEPEVSKVGDSGKEITLKNITWGNLVNLSDPAYGLERLTLRPAALNTEKATSLITNPLYAAVYGGDGRLIRTTNNFAYTYYDPDTRFFMVPETGVPSYGVRAISSVRYVDVTGDAVFSAMYDDAEKKLTDAGDAYIALTQRKDYIDAITALMGAYVDRRLDATKNPDCGPQVEALYNMMVDFSDVLETAGESMVVIANMQLKIASEDGNYEAYTLDSLCNTTEAALTANKVSLITWKQYVNDRKNLAINIAKLKVYYDAYRENRTPVPWTSIEGIVNFMVDIQTCEIGGYPMSSISSHIQDLASGGKKQAVIKNGALYRMEQRIGRKMNVQNVSVTANVAGFSRTVQADITTAASSPYQLRTDLDDTVAKKPDVFGGGTPVAEDTYGLAIDFWVRTNASGACLTLEGDVIWDYQPVIVEREGLKMQLYKDASGNEFYKYDGKYYNEAAQEVPADGLTQVTEKVAVGYTGVNRVWDENTHTYLTDYSTTQGHGSCYVFYANTEAEQTRFLELLKYMKVEFIDAAGTRLATAVMDTKNAVAENGKVTVPMQLSDSNSISLGMNLQGEEQYGIVWLTKGVAKRITAIVYLDGLKLDNTMVLAASDIQGQLNIQFGSSDKLNPLENEKLAAQEIRVSATVDRNEFTYERGNPAVANVTLQVIGEGAVNQASCRFLRAISSTQGALQDSVSFAKNGDNWKASVTFDHPGTYILRSVWLDGSEYTLERPITVNVSGFAVQSLSCDACVSGTNYGELMTAKNAVTSNVELSFAASLSRGADNNLPTSVKAVFLDSEKRQTTVNLTASSTGWSGKVTFVNSETYTLQYLELDGEQYLLPDELQKTVKVILGIKTRVWISETRFDFEEKTLTVTATVTDNNNTPLENLDGVVLYYNHKVNGLYNLDTNLTWDPAQKVYTGAFHVTKPGMYSFSQVSIGSNEVNMATAPNIVAMLPDPVAYHSNGTPDYQFAPNKDAVFTVNMAYSEAASSVSAILVKDGTEYEVNAKLAADGTSAGGAFVEDEVTITRWVFPIPAAIQEGNWQIKSLKMKDVFYAGQLQDKTPAEINVWGRNITTKVVNYIHVNVQAVDNGEEGKVQFTGAFMTDHKVSNTKLAVTDYAGEAIHGVNSVNLVYMLDTGSISTAVGPVKRVTGGTEKDVMVGYTCASLGTVPTRENPGYGVTCAQISGTEYQTEEMNFLYAGRYKCQATVRINGTEYTSEQACFDLTGSPEYAVTWSAPDITVTGTNPAPGTNFTVNLGGSTNKNFATTSNYFEPYYAYLGMKATSGMLSASYTAPQVTLQIKNRGNSNSVTMGFAVDSTTCKFTFAKNSNTVTAYMGRVGDGDSTNGSATRHSVNGDFMAVSMIDANSKEFALETYKPIKVVTSNSPKPALQYVFDSKYTVDSYEFRNQVTLPAAVTPADGRGFTVTLPADLTFTVDEETATSEVLISDNTTTSVVYTEQSKTSGCTTTTTYTSYNRTTRVEKYQSEMTAKRNTYRVKEWIIEKANSTTNYNSISGSPTSWDYVTRVKAGTTRTISTNERAIPVFEVIDSQDLGGGSSTKTRTVTTITDKQTGTGLSSKPSDGTKVNENQIYTSPHVTETIS